MIKTLYIRSFLSIFFIIFSISKYQYNFPSKSNLIRLKWAYRKSNIRIPSNIDPSQKIFICSHFDKLINYIINTKFLLFPFCLPPNSCFQVPCICFMLVPRVYKHFIKNQPWIYTFKFSPNCSNLLSKKCSLCFQCIRGSLINLILRFSIKLVFFISPHPLKKRIINKNITIVRNQFNILCQCIETWYHTFFENAIETYRIHQLLKTFSQSKRNKLRNRNLETSSKTVPEVYHHNTCWTHLYEEIF